MFRGVQFAGPFALVLIPAFVCIPCAGSSSREGWSVPLPPALQSSIRRVATTEPTAEPPPNAPPLRRLPNGYAKLGLSDQQREAIYKIRGEYKARMDQLQRELDTLKRAEADACRSILTETQRRLIDQSKPRSAASGTPPLP